MKRLNASFPATFAATALAASLLAVPSLAQPVADSPAATPAGTVMTFHRKSSGSLGTFDGPVVWTISHGTWEGRPAVMQMARLGGSAFDPKTHANMATLDAEGKATMVFDPPVGYQWPLQVGKTWTSKHTATTPATGRSVPLEVNWKVEAWEDVTVPAGTFKTYKVVTTNNFGEVETRWTAPGTGIVLAKRLVTRPATHPQGAGELEAVLLSQVPPAK
ncbi:MAG: hypothetical protein HGA21_13995 [Burkholderiaceae bacterium]|nr:hypothetical protein [Burkholderiaceae bacterium]